MAATTLIWAVDPYQNHPEADKKITGFFTELGKSCELKIKPVYVMGAAVNRIGDYFQPIEFTEIVPTIRADFAKYLKNFSQFNLAPFELLENFNDSQAADIQQFDSFVRAQKPDYVFMLSNGRKGWARTFLGSFTENYLLRTDTPTFVVTPKTEFSRPMNHGLFPLELDEKSKAFVEKFLDDHKLAFISRLCLFHKISMTDYQDVAWGPTLYDSALPEDTSDLTTQAADQCEKYFQTLLDHPLAQKRLQYDISDRFETITEAVQHSLKENNCGLTIIRSHAGPWESRLLGSVTKLIIRDTTSPLLIYPYHFEKQ